MTTFHRIKVLVRFPQNGYFKFLSTSSSSTSATSKSSTTSPSKLRSTYSHPQYCMELVKKQDYESFLCTLLINDNRLRRNVFSIRAFNTEISTIRDQISNKSAGLGRLVFWRDSIHKLFTAKNVKEDIQIPKQPILLELYNAIRENDVSKKWFSKLIDSRERTIEDLPFESLEDLEDYCDASVTPIFYLTLELLGIKNIQIDHAASHLGKAIGLVNFIRALPYHSKRKTVLVPKDLLRKHDLNVMNFVKIDEPDKIKELIFDLASQANAHYEKAKTLDKSQRREARPVFLYGIPSGIYLKRLQYSDFNPYTPALSLRYGYLPLQLYYRKITGSYP